MRLRRGMLILDLITSLTIICFLIWVFGAVIGIILLAISRSLSGLLMAVFMVLFMLALAAIHYHPASEAQKAK